LREALLLAQQSGGHLTVLHVVDRFPHETVYSAASVPRLLDEFDERAREITRRLRATIPPGALDWCDVEYRVLPGVPHITIAATAAAQAADLIVIGRPPRHWLGAVGSTVTGVLARATCPVLTIPGPAGLRPDLDMRRGGSRDVEGFRSLSTRGARTLHVADAAHPGGG
jgi:nucleotide-binding universal stress UspA family protein